MSDLDEPRMVMLPAETLEQIGRSVGEFARFFQTISEGLAYLVERQPGLGDVLRLEAKVDQLIKALKSAGVGFWNDGN